ncbi:NUDIX hydrolase [Tuberibacillus sp. Marseille-P3662]|uniref:NUDIX hydrolase n=1 Tax=Tuberibacillus sp. Marseille-P3662 TaxID=1965358 RepID=UPI000A1CBDA7|nr:NUDIX domain-containing protein [Tuberibacillus sp. Marseille-P3662]
MTDYILDLRKRVGNMPLVLSVAGCLIVDEQHRVLLQHRVDNDTWSIPGGIVEPGESVEDTVKREVYEETNLQVNQIDFFNIYSGDSQHYIYPNGDEVFFVNIVYVSREYSGQLMIDHVESKNTKFWDINELPQLTPPNKKILAEFARY